jgi:hypothetical protein
MDDALLLAELEAQARTAPSFSQSYAPPSTATRQWLGQTHALLARYDEDEARAFQVASDNLGIAGLPHDMAVSKVHNILHRAVADLRWKLMGKPGAVVGPGAAYDFYKALRDTLQSAASSLFIIDPYMDDEVFDYLSGVSPGVAVRLLTMHKPAPVKAAMPKFLLQYPMQMGARQAPPKSLHDRVVFVDGTSCFVLGQSIKDAAKKSTTYLAPLSGDLVADKLAAYEAVWTSATVI